MHLPNLMSGLSTFQRCTCGQWSVRHAFFSCTSSPTLFSKGYWFLEWSWCLGGSAFETVLVSSEQVAFVFAKPKQLYSSTILSIVWVLGVNIEYFVLLGSDARSMPRFLISNVIIMGLTLWYLQFLISDIKTASPRMPSPRTAGMTIPKIFEFLLSTTKKKDIFFNLFSQKNICMYF